MKRAGELLKVSRSAYYQHRAAGPSPRERVDTELAERIAEVHEASAGTYGSARVHAELHAQGRRHSRADQQATTAGPPTDPVTARRWWYAAFCSRSPSPPCACWPSSN